MFVHKVLDENKSPAAVSCFASADPDDVAMMVSRHSAAHYVEHVTWHETSCFILLLYPGSGGKGQLIVPSQLEVEAASLLPLSVSLRSQERRDCPGLGTKDLIIDSA